MAIDVGVVVLPTDRWRDAAGQWRWVEDAGFASAYTYDHLQWGGFPEGPWHAAIPVLAAAATVTERVRLGTLVTSPNFRHPVPLARDVITLDDLSAGRLDLGIGAGSERPDGRLLGRPPWSGSERLGRFEEFVALLDQLLTGSPVSSAGRYYSAHQVPTTPGCRQEPRVPFTVAAAGSGAMRVAARHGQRWVTYGAPGGGRHTLSGTLDAVRDQCGRLAAACAEAGRDISTLGKVLLWTDPAPPSSADAFDDLAGPYEELGVTEIVLHHPTQTGPYGGRAAVFEQIAARHRAP